jgi:hypothetical protein
MRSRTVGAVIAGAGVGRGVGCAARVGVVTGKGAGSAVGVGAMPGTLHAAVKSNKMLARNFIFTTHLRYVHSTGCVGAGQTKMPARESCRRIGDLEIARVTA